MEIVRLHLATSTHRLRDLGARIDCLGRVHAKPCTETNATLDKVIDRVTSGMERFESTFARTRPGRWFARRIDDSPRFARFVRGILPRPATVWDAITLRFARDDGTAATATIEIQRPGRSAVLVRRTLIAAAITAVSPIPLTGLFVGGLAALRTGIEAAFEASLGDVAGVDASLASMRSLAVVATLGSIPGLSFIVPGLIVREHGQSLRELAMSPIRLRAAS